MRGQGQNEETGLATLNGNVGTLLARPVELPLPDPSNIKPIKRVTITHLRMVALHLQGLSNGEVALALDKSTPTVWVVLNNPTIRPIIDRALSECDDSLRALAPLSVVAIRDGLVHHDPKVRLAAVDRLYRATGRYRENDAGEVTAEDVIQRIIKIKHGDAEVTIAEERRRA